MPDIKSGVSFDSSIAVDDVAKRTARVKLGKATVTGDTYTNANPTIEDFGGIAAGSTFSGKTTTEMWDALLYPYIDPEVVLSITGVAPALLREKGNNLGTLALRASVTKKSDNITGVRFYRGLPYVVDHTPGAILPGTATYDWTGTAAITSTVGMNPLLFDGKYFKVEVDDASPATVTSNVLTVQFVYPYFYGVGAPGLTAQQLYTAFNASGKIIQTQAGTTSVATSPSSQIWYFMYPAAYDLLSSIYDENGFIYNIDQADPNKDWNIRTGNVTGLDGSAVLYRIYEFVRTTTQADFTNTFNK